MINELIYDFGQMFLLKGQQSFVKCVFIRSISENRCLVALESGKIYSVELSDLYPFDVTCLN